jgi:hypothetical protein
MIDTVADFPWGDFSRTVEFTIWLTAKPEGVGPEMTDGLVDREGKERRQPELAPSALNRLCSDAGYIWPMTTSTITTMTTIPIVPVGA